MYIQIYKIYMYINTIIENRNHEAEGEQGGWERGKGRDKSCNYITIS